MIRFAILALVAVHPLFSSLLIGIAGGTGSGKTTLAQKIASAFPEEAVLISQDLYYKDQPHLTFEERAKLNFDHPASLDFELLREQLTALKAQQPVRLPAYCFKTHSRLSETRPVEPAKLILVEGILLFAVPEIRDLFDLKIYVDAEDDIRLLRRIERDIHERGRDLEGIKEQYLATVKPMHDLFVEPSKKSADIIVPRGGHNKVALNMIHCLINQHLVNSTRAPF